MPKLDNSAVDGSAIDKIQNLTLAAYQHHALDNSACPAVLVPNDARVQSLESLAHARYRFRGQMRTSCIADFVSYSIQNASNPGVSCFIDADSMSATTIFNIGTIDNPGHADHIAVMKLKKTAPFSALLNINGEKNRQKELAEWLEDWRDYLTAFDAGGEVLDIKQAIAAVRNVTIEALSSANHEDNDFNARRSLMQSVEAKSKDIMPAVFEFKCIPYEGLSERRFKLRHSIITHDTPLFVLRIVQLEQCEEEMAIEFRDLLISKFDKQPVETFIGNFDPK